MLNGPFRRGVSWQSKGKWRQSIFGSGGKFSSLMLDFILRREIGHYVLEYYIPSLLLVAMSWVGFWLDPNAVPGRCVIELSIYLNMNQAK